MESSLTSSRGGDFVWTTDPRSLLKVRKLLVTLPTFLADSLLSSQSDATVKLFAHDWIGVVTNGNLFLWRYTHSKDPKVATSSICRQFELPSSDASVTTVSVSCFEGDSRPRLCAAAVAGILRVWPRGVFGAVSRSQVVHDVLDTRLTALKVDEQCASMEEGPCPGTFLLATNHGRIFGVDARTSQDQVFTFFVTENNSIGTTTDPPLLSSTQGYLGDGNTSLLSGLSRRVSSIWSYATSKVPVLNTSGVGTTVVTSSTGKVLRFLVHTVSPNSCHACLLTQSRLAIWLIDTDFEATLLLNLELNNMKFGEAVDMTSTFSSPLVLWLLCKSLTQEDGFCLFPVHVKDVARGEEPPQPVSFVMETKVSDYQLVTSLPGTDAYPCTLVALFSRDVGIVHIVEALTGRCISQIEFEETSPLLAVVSSQRDSTALFTIITRQRGIYAILGEEPCLPTLNCYPLIAQLTSSSTSSKVDPDQLLEALSKIAIMLWMGFEEEVGNLVNSLFASPRRKQLAAVTTRTFLRLARRILNSRPTNGPDARWRNPTSNSLSAFDFAQIGDSRFTAKQQGMQNLGGRLWRSVMSALASNGKDFSNCEVTDVPAVLSDLFAPISSRCEADSVYHTGHHRYHILNAFLSGAEACECARALHSRWSRLKQNHLLKPVFKKTVEAAVLAGVISGGDTHSLLSPEDLFFQAVSLVPCFIANLAEHLVSQTKTCLTDNTDAVDFVACAVQLLVASLSETLDYRQKLLPALKSFLSEEVATGGTDNPIKFDLFCWITGIEAVCSHLLEAFDSLADLVAALSGDADRMLVDGGSLRQECACRGVELATLILQATSQRVRWPRHSANLDTWYEELKAKLISTVAWRINRPEAALDLAIRFLDKKLILEISDHLDKHSADGKQHINLMHALARSPPDSQLADYALQWHYSHGEKARLQSLLVVLQEREVAGESLKVQDRQKRSTPMVQSATSAKRSRQASETCVTRFLQRREARDFAWLHQLGNRDFDQASQGLLTAGVTEITSLHRRRTLLSLSKLASIAAGHLISTTDFDNDPLPSDSPVDKYLEVIRLQEEWLRRKKTPGDGDASVFSAATLARLFVTDTGFVSHESSKDGLLATFAVALRLCRLAMEVDEPPVEAGTEQQDLLNDIWSQAVKVDSWKKPDEGGDFNGACENSFFCALLERSLATGEDIQTILPPMKDFLASVESEYEPWLRILVENAYNLVLKRNPSQKPESSSILMEL